MTKMIDTITFCLGWEDNSGREWTAIRDEGQPFNLIIGRRPESGDWPNSTDENIFSVPSWVPTDIRITVSRLHVRIFRSDETIWIEDCETPNLTRLDDGPIFSPTPIDKFPCHISLGGLKLILKKEVLEVEQYEHLQKQANIGAEELEHSTLVVLDDDEHETTLRESHDRLRAVRHVSSILGVCDRAEDARIRLKEILAAHLRAEDLSIAFSLSEEELLIKLENDSYHKNVIQKVREEISKLPECGICWVRDDGECQFIWVVDAAGPRRKKLSLVIGYFSALRYAELDGQGADEMILISLQLAVPLVNSLESKERLEAATSRKYLRTPNKDTIETARNSLKLVGNSPAFLSALGEIEVVAKRCFIDVAIPGDEEPNTTYKPPTAFLKGEGGTGKTAFAELLHTLSMHSSSGEFIPFSCTEVSPDLLYGTLFGWKKGAFTGADKDYPGLFGFANGGTIFIDEIGKATLEFQTSILRVVETGCYRPLGANKSERTNAFIILAAREDIPKLIEKKRFVEELWQRIRRPSIEIPPLRERLEDLESLAKLKIGELNRIYGENKYLEKITLERLSESSWKGNIREFLSVVQCAYQFTDPKIREIDFDSFDWEADEIERRNPAEDLADAFRRMPDLSLSHVEWAYLAHLYNKYEFSKKGKRGAAAAQADVKLERLMGMLPKIRRARRNNGGKVDALLKPIAGVQWPYLLDSIQSAKNPGPKKKVKP